MKFNLDNPIEEEKLKENASMNFNSSKTPEPRVPPQPPEPRVPPQPPKPIYEEYDPSKES